MTSLVHRFVEDEGEGDNEHNANTFLTHYARAAVTATSAATTANESSSSAGTSTTTSWSETALDWWHRTRLLRQNVPVNNPDTAAWAFCRHPGWPFWTPFGQPRRPPPIQGERLHLPLVEISGPVAKTTLLVTMAAQFVVQTRASRFRNGTGREPTNSVLAPQVYILDAEWQITPQHIAQRIRSLLLCDYNAMEAHQRRQDNNNQNDAAGAAADNSHPINDNEAHKMSDWERLQVDCEACFQRIHVGQADENNSAGWLPLLASLEDTECYDHPMLVLGDGVLDHKQQYDTSGGSTSDLCRALLRILSRPQAPTMVVYTTRYAWPRRRNNEWDDRVTHRIRLEKAAASVVVPPYSSSSPSSHDYVAFCDGQSSSGGEADGATGIPFSITGAGIRG